MISIEAVHFGQFTSRSSAAGAAIWGEATRGAGCREGRSGRRRGSCVGLRREPHLLDELRIVAEEELRAALSRDLLEPADAGERGLVVDALAGEHLVGEVLREV